MALNDFKCNYLMSLHFYRLKHASGVMNKLKLASSQFRGNYPHCTPINRSPHITYSKLTSYFGFGFRQNELKRLLQQTLITSKCTKPFCDRFPHRTLLAKPTALPRPTSWCWLPLLGEERKESLRK